MIYLVSSKYFKKHVTELISSNDYFLIDGENYGVTGRSTGTISESYGSCHTMGSFCPETDLYKILKRMARGMEYNHKQMEKLTKQFLKNKDFKAAVIGAVKAQCAFDYDINVIIILPSIVMKTIGKLIAKQIQRVIKTNFKFIMIDKELPKKKKLEKFMSHGLKRKQLKKLYKQIKRIEKKFKGKLGKDNDDDSVWSNNRY